MRNERRSTPNPVKTSRAKTYAAIKCLSHVAKSLIFPEDCEVAKLNGVSD
jgi:hypothetical protein